MKKNIEEVIKKLLEDTKANCEFKKAWIPDGWACVPINMFSKELAKNLMKEEEV